MLQSLLNSALNKRNSLKSITNAIRLVNGEGDSLPGLVIEQYNRHFVIHLYREPWLEALPEIKDWLVNSLFAQYIIVKYRSAPDGRILDNPKSGVLLNNASSKTIVYEYDTQFLVDLNDTVNSGLFLDMRHNRNMLGKICKGKKVLNTFAYTCSFGVYARKNGAILVNNVDISSKNLKKGEENYKLNGLSRDSKEFICSDSLKFMERALKHQNFYDLIIIDPPSFSRVERKVFQIKRDLPKLLDISLKIIKPQGYLFVSTNYSGINTEKLIAMIKKSCLVHQKTINSVSITYKISEPTVSKLYSYFKSILKIHMEELYLSLNFGVISTQEQIKYYDREVIESDCVIGEDD